MLRVDSGGTKVFRQVVKDARGEADPEEHEDNPGLCCRVCDQRITQFLFQISLGGERQFVRTNPAGQTFRFYCFSEAKGVEVRGPAYEEHSWFAGYHWQFAYCSQCHLQLGWYFSQASGDSGAYFALIDEQLGACEQPSDA